MVAFKGFFYIVQALFCAVTVKLEKVSISHQGLVSVPFEDISINVTKLFLNGNAITLVDEFLFFPQLSHLFLARNCISVFPNLSNVSATLSTLGLPDNILSHIPAERLNVLTALTYLNLTNNSLSHFPNVPGPGNTLRSLYLGVNLFKLFPNLSEIGRKLRTIGLQNNFLANIDLNLMPEGKERTTTVRISGNTNLTRIPNLSFWNLESLEILQMKISCDCKTGWIKMAEAGGMAVQIDNEPCGSPDDLVDKAWADLPLGQFTCNGQVQMSEHYKLIDDNYGGKLVPVEQQDNFSLLGCAILCKTKAGCFAYGYSKATANKSSACFLTGDGLEVQVSSLVNLQWYAGTFD